MARKRAMEAIESQLQPAKKNKVVLGELSNNALAFGSQTMRYIPVKIPKLKCRSKKLKKAAVKTPELSAEKFNEKSNDPQMCEAYVADIYGYLHNMETLCTHHLLHR